jgi:hypothetical protein
VTEVITHNIFQEPFTVFENVALLTALETCVINVNMKRYKNVNDWPCLCTCNVLLCVISN